MAREKFLGPKWSYFVNSRSTADGPGPHRGPGPEASASLASWMIRPCSSAEQLHMAFVRSQRRTHCTSYCRCSEMTPQIQSELIIYDFQYWRWYHRERLTPKYGVLFKLLVGCPRSYGVGPNTLYELAFKTTSILCENFVRKTFFYGTKIHLPPMAL